MNNDAWAPMLVSLSFQAREEALKLLKMCWDLVGFTIIGLALVLSLCLWVVSSLGFFASQLSANI